MQRSVLVVRAAAVLAGMMIPILAAVSSPASTQSSSTKPVRIVLVGDSTVAEESGWGPGFRRLAREGVDVQNFAANGRSSKSFMVSR